MLVSHVAFLIKWSSQSAHSQSGSSQSGLQPLAVSLGGQVGVTGHSDRRFLAIAE